MFGLLCCFSPFSAVSTICTFSAFSTFSTISAIGSCPADERFFKNRRVVVKSLVFDERIRRPAGVPLPARLPHGFHDARDGRCGKVGAPALVHDRVHAREEAWGDDAHDRAEGERLAVFEGDFGRKLPALHGFVGNGENGVVGEHAFVGAPPEAVPPEQWGITVLGPGAAVADDYVLPANRMRSVDGKETVR